MRLKHVAAAVAFAVMTSVVHADTVPLPGDMYIDIIVSGRTSTLGPKGVEIVKTGKTIPKIYRGKHIVKNTRGFDWYVSKHYALKTNESAKRAELFLTMAEMSYPHYVEIIGREPPGISTTRMPFVHATNIKELQRSIKDDLDGGFWDNRGAGGVTLPASFAAYNFPSGGLAYHKRDLSMHENMHLFELCVNNEFYTPHYYGEGVTTGLSKHVWDPEKKQLTIGVFDTAPMNNPTATGLRSFKQNGKGANKIKDQIVRDSYDIQKSHKINPYDLASLYTMFHWTNPDRLMKWRILRDEYFNAKLTSKDRLSIGVKVQKQLWGGSLAPLQSQWEKWLKTANESTTYFMLNWGWEQWGDMLSSYGWSKPCSQLNINYKPGEAFRDNGLSLDYPRQNPQSHLVGKIKGGATPTVGVLVGVKREGNFQGGWAGMALGLKDPVKFKNEQFNGVRVIVEGNENARYLTIAGEALGMNLTRSKVDFPAEMVKAINKKGHVGLTITINKKSIDVVAKAGEKGSELHEITGSLAISNDVYRRLINKRMGLVSSGGNHEFTPYFVGNQQKDPVDYNKQAPSNRWRYAGDAQTYSLYRAAFRMGKKSPKSLLSLKKKMITAMDQPKAKQTAAIAMYNKSIKKVIADIKKVGGKTANAALAELASLSLTIAPTPDATANKPKFAANLLCRDNITVKGSLKITPSRKDVFASPALNQKFTNKPGEETIITWEPKPGSNKTDSFTVNATAKVVWRGATITLNAEAAMRPTIPTYYIIGPFDNKGTAMRDTKQPIEDDGFIIDKTYRGKGGREIKWKKVARSQKASMTEEFVVDFNKRIAKISNVSAYAVTWVKSPRAMTAQLVCGSDDSIKIWVNGELVHNNITERGYKSRADRAEITLRKGENEILFKIGNSAWGWNFGADIIDLDSNAIPELKYYLK